ncbi:response regulator [Paenibacillus athensensis]|uniref:AraC family transcriptional regulator n=1 Tax=Paenibacillus athensensis TaxID=1967502 RepID=A0A4Y8PY64_9BACL|nr:response regulator [Paenibacillus athensensis]MCD1259680.1 response regulator [Paenibacillus athensensis]
MLQILLVDDEPFVVDDLSITVPWSDLGYEQVHVAYSGQMALDILQINPIDVVLSDISMPEMNGLQLIGHIRSRWKHIKCVLLTGYAEFDYARKAIELQASRYLLKPLSDEELVEVLGELREEIRREWDTLASYQLTMQTLREHLPLLRDKLLNGLLQGRRFAHSQLAEQLSKYQLAFKTDAPAALMIVRLEDYFQKHDTDSLLLFEYAIVNIAGELFGQHFQLWSCKDAHDYIVFLLQPKADERGGAAFGGEADEAQMWLIQTACQLQRNVNALLKGEISVVTTEWGLFPAAVGDMYQTAIATIRQYIGQETSVFLTAGQAPPAHKVPALLALYEPPTLLHLFEASRWDAIHDKLQAVFEELKERNAHSAEHLREARSSLETAFYYIAHKNNKLLAEIVGDALEEGKIFHSPDRLADWAAHIVGKLKEHFETERKDLRAGLIEQVHAYVDSHLSYISLQAIADHVGLHPVYLSKVYKTMTGKSIGDYLFQLKMEKAAHLLTSSELKIYEIAAELGYSSAHYFIKLFKDYSRMTPQEYRDRAAPHKSTKSNNP